MNQIEKLKGKTLIKKIILITSIMLIATNVFAVDLTQVGRYSTVDNKPTAAQINPLLAVSQFQFPASVRTVGQAVQMVLDNTGYQLATYSQQSMSVRDTLQKSLPITNRELGPLPIKTVLTILMGQEVFNLIADPLHRIVNFEVKPSIARALGVKTYERIKRTTPTESTQVKRIRKTRIARRDGKQKEQPTIKTSH